MSRRNTVETLPPDVREKINAALYQSGFSDYSGVVAALQAEGHQISRSALHRHGKKLQARIDQMTLEKMLAAESGRS